MTKLSGLIIFVLSFIFKIAVSQSEYETVYRFFENYNTSKYDKIKKDIIPIAKLLISSEQIKKSLEPIKDNWGNFTIRKIEEKSKNKIIATVISEIDTTEREQFVFNLTNKGKIRAFYKKDYDYNYPLTDKIKSTLNIEKNKIDSLLYAKYHYGNFNGSIAVMINNDIIFKKSYGYKSYFDKTILNDSSIFYLASCSKQFTAYAILLLEEKGLLKITDTIQQYIPNFPYKNITIQHLLTHTSGLPDYISLMDKYWNTQKTANNTDVISMLIKYKPKIYFKPNENFDYSNTGYVILATIIEICSKKSYADFIQNEIFTPLHFSSSNISSAAHINTSQIKNWAIGHIYSYNKKRYIVADSLPENNFVNYLGEICGDGNINCSINDIVKWTIELNNPTLLKKNKVELMFVNYKLKNGQSINYGYGECIKDNPNYQKQVYHTGGWVGYHTSIHKLIESGITIIILSNNEYPSLSQLTDKIFQIMLGN